MQYCDSTETQSAVEADHVSNSLRMIRAQRKRAHEAQSVQAERMDKRSKRVFGPVEVCDNVTIPIPQVDRGRADPRNIIGIVTECSDNAMFTVVVKSGILNVKYSRNQINVCATKLYTIDDFNTEKTISLRLAVQYESKCDGQGFSICNCACSKRCGTNRFRCYKAKMLCNSRCHSTWPCARNMTE